jgi:hypothetical protein
MFAPIEDQSMADKPLSVRVKQEIYEAVRSLPNSSAWLRTLITEAAQRELMGGDRS